LGLLTSFEIVSVKFGLGAKTGIDLPIESFDFKGIEKKLGYLLDLSIGQYDTYTPLQLAQYISTIANSGYRVKPITSTG
jgi:cell division protein FtsI/penicillin-binding protein 2